MSKTTLQRLKEQGLTRRQTPVTPLIPNHLQVQGIDCIDFSSNDYLGLARDPRIKDAFILGVQHYGFGSGASAAVCGYYDIQQTLETRFAEWIGAERALFFNSGYLANIGVISALTTRKTVLFADKHVHASLIDGIHLSGAKHIRYHHLDLTHFDYLTTKHIPDCIVTESVFSMDGHLSPIQSLAHRAKTHNAQLIIDDAHGIGVLGTHGRGIIEEANLSWRDVTCLITPLGKAFNSIGAMVSGSYDIIETILQFAKSYRYTTALPPANLFATLKALDLVIEESYRRKILQSNITYFTTVAQAHHLPIIENPYTPIQSVLIGHNQRLMDIQQQLLNNGFLVSAMRPPTVPEHTARLRISLHSTHQKSDILALINTLKEALTVCI